MLLLMPDALKLRYVVFPRRENIFPALFIKLSHQLSMEGIQL